MKRLFLFLLIIALTQPAVASELDGVWNGILDSVYYSNGGKVDDWVFNNDGTTTGRWTMDIGGGVTVSSDNASGTYTYETNILDATYTGTATEDGYGTTTSYTLYLTDGVVDGNTATGNYRTVFDYALGWPSIDEGTFSLEREVSTNLPPVIESVSASPAYILDNQTSSLEVVASDSDGPSPLSYNWTIQPSQGSLDDYNSPSPIYTPPDIASSQQIFTITVDVSDGQDVNSASVNITVIDINSITCDFYQDGFIDFYDYAILAAYFADTNCSEPNWCEGTDVDHSGSTDILEFSIFAERWLTEVIDPDLLAYWPLNDNDSNTFVSDISGNGHNGTASANTSLLSAPGMVNTCFDFAGTYAVQISDDDVLSFGNGSADTAFSTTAWIYVTETGNNQAILSKWNTGAGNAKEWEFYLNSTLKLGFFAADQSAGKFAYVHSDDALTEGWHFVAVVYDSEDASWTAATAADFMTLYVDGSAVSSTATTLSGYEGMENLDAPLLIGAAASAGVNQTYFADKIDNVKIFSKCLTVAEITALYGEGL